MRFVLLGGPLGGVEALNVHCVVRGSADSKNFEIQISHSGEFEDVCVLGRDAL
jgi:hypothetical protein